jgi:hypothetical protein
MGSRGFVAEFDWCAIGDVKHSQIPNIIDLTSIVAFLFSGDPAPDPKKVADINGNFTVNVVDLNYFVNFLFGGGADPKIGCAP